MKNKSDVMGFEMIVEDNNSISVKRKYPKDLSNDEIESAEKKTAEVTLHCFEAARVQELQSLVEKITKRYKMNIVSTKRKRFAFLNVMKGIF